VPNFARTASRGLFAIMTLALVAVAAFPLYWMALSASLPIGSLFTTTPTFIPQSHIFETLAVVFHNSMLTRWLTNSAVIAAGTAVLSLAMGLLAAYALSRFRFRGRSAFGFLLFATQMLPEALVVVPLYSLFLGLGLLNGLTGLVLVNVAFVMPIVAWIIKGAIDAVPVELEEAAEIDGCSRLATLGTVVVPLIMPSLAAGAVIAFFHGWNEFMFASTFIQDKALWPASVGIASFIGDLSAPMDEVMAASLVYTIPAVAFFLLAQRHVVAGLTAGSVKG
jgi:multiple sugar transport system permease protein